MLFILMCGSGTADTIRGQGPFDEGCSQSRRRGRVEFAIAEQLSCFRVSDDADEFKPHSLG